MIITLRLSYTILVSSLTESLKITSSSNHVRVYKSRIVCMCAQSCLTLRSHGLWPARVLYSWDFPGKNTGVRCHFLLKGISPTQRSNSSLPSLLPWQADSLPLCHLGSPKRRIGVYYIGINIRLKKKVQYQLQ